VSGNINGLLASSGVPTEEKPAELLPKGARMVYLHAGNMHVSRDSAQVITILGSCVAVCLWDRLMRVGGINHFMLPVDIGVQTSSLRYANFAMSELLRQMLELGAETRRMEAKVFGGACVLGGVRAGQDLGSKNVEAARERLAAERIKVMGEDVGGNRGRRLVFRTWDGSALVKTV
jgi:chemotaxis protein CheD